MPALMCRLHTDDELILSVSDNGVGIASPEHSKKGVGSKVIGLLVQQLNGTLVYEDAQAGCRVVLTIQKPKL